MQYVIAYDVAEDRKREKLSRLLEDYGDRVQKSVFEAELDADELQHILKEAARYVTAKDSLRVYALCRAWAGNAQALGKPKPAVAEGWVLI